MLDLQQTEYVLNAISTLTGNIGSASQPVKTLTEIEAKAAKNMQLRRANEQVEAQITAVIEEHTAVIADELAVYGFQKAMIQAQQAIIGEDREMAAIAATKATDFYGYCQHTGGLKGLGQAALMVASYLDVLFLLE